VAPVGLALALDLQLVDQLVLVGVLDLPLHLQDGRARLGGAGRERDRRLLAPLPDGEVGDPRPLVLLQVVDRDLAQDAGAEAGPVLQVAPRRARDRAARDLRPEALGRAQLLPAAPALGRLGRVARAGLDGEPGAARDQAAPARRE